MYDFENREDQDLVDFWGFNEGEPIYRPDSYGMLNGSTNILQTACPAIGKASPYFKRVADNQTLNEYLSDTLEDLNKQKIDFK